MALHIIGRGIGFAPGSTKFIPTRGFTPLVSPTTFSYSMSGGGTTSGAAGLRKTKHYAASGGGTTGGAATVVTAIVTTFTYTMVGGGTTGGAAVTAFVSSAQTIPTGGTVRVGLISDRPQITYDGSGLINRIIPFGVNYDGSDLTLEFASPDYLPYPILNDGDTWYLEDTASIAAYGLYEQKVYRSDVKVPPTHDNAITGQPGQPTGLNQQLLTIGDVCTAGDFISFTWEGVTYTYTFASSPVNGEIGVGSTAGEQQQLILSAFAGADGHNLNYGVVALGHFYNNVAVINASQRGDIGISATFTSGSNYLGGGQDGSDPPSTSPPASAPTALGGGDLGIETANVLYALAVNTLIKQRSEILGLRVVVANGADIWALPGDRMQVKYRGIADTAESLAVNGNSRIVWLDIDEAMLVVERHDRSDPSGIRQVEFMLACPTIQYPVPAIPTWDDPVSLPVPSNTGSFPGSDETGAGDNPPFEGYTPPDIPPYTPAADWVADTLGSILTGNKLPFPSCCPDPTTDITSGTGLLPPNPAGESQSSAIGAPTPSSSSGTDPVTQVYTDSFVPSDTTVVLLFLHADSLTATPTVEAAAVANCIVHELGRVDLQDGKAATPVYHQFRAYAVESTGGTGSYSVTGPVGDTSVIAGKVTNSLGIAAADIVIASDKDTWGPQDGPYDNTATAVASITAVKAGDFMLACTQPSSGAAIVDQSTTYSVTFNGITTVGATGAGLLKNTQLSADAGSFDVTFAQEDVQGHAPGAGGPEQVTSKPLVWLARVRVTTP
jgi:hypothetical protein